MITMLYVLLLMAASAEDYISHKVNRAVVSSVWLLGIIRIVLEKENRWVTVALTCICFILLYAYYKLMRHLAEHCSRPLAFGGADVKLIPAMMLVQGWDAALLGIFIGLLAVSCRYVISARKKQEIPLIPWMSAGCILVEIFYLFFGKSVL